MKMDGTISLFDISEYAKKVNSFFQILQLSFVLKKRDLIYQHLPTYRTESVELASYITVFTV
jgi:hypothetical protein